MKQYIFTIFLIFSSYFSFTQVKNEKIISVSNQDCKVYDANYIEGKTYEWQGGIKDNFANGVGVLSVFIKDTIYEKIEARFINGIAEGEGEIERPEQEIVIQGVFKDGLINGPGKIIKQNGYEYMGNLINNVEHGKGKIVYGSGSSFEGTFRSGVFWTGKYLNLQDNEQFFYRQEEVESLPQISNYDPKLNTLLTEYFDENWNRCDKSIATYYRKVIYKAPHKPDGLIRNYYINGTLLSEFKCLYIDYNDDYLNFHDEGVVKYYYNSGELASERNYNLNNSYYGSSISYYRNGEIKNLVNYNLQGLKQGPEYSYDNKGKISGFSYYENGELWKERYFEIDENGLWSSLHKEDFEKNSEFWYQNDYSSVFKNILFLSHKEKDDIYYRTKEFDLNNEIDYGLVAEVKVDKNQVLRLIFGYLNNSNYSSFNISAKEAVILHYEDGKLAAGDRVKLKRKKGVNTYAIRIYNGEIRFLINNENIYNCKLWDFRGNEAGIAVSGKGDGFIRNFLVKTWFNKEQSKILEDNFLKNLEKGSGQNDLEYWDGNGSGFFLSKDGYIATNHHVIEGAKEIQVEYLSNGEKKVYKAEVVISDKISDLAILEIRDEKFVMNHSIPYGLDFTIQDIGSEVFALGYPMADVLGDEIKYTEGAISSKTGFNGDISTYQISVPIQPGNSGGPLFDANGNVVGITSSILNRKIFESENVNYAIKISYLKNLIDVLPKELKTTNSNVLKTKSKTEKIKELSSFIPIIRVKL